MFEQFQIVYFEEYPKWNIFNNVGDLKGVVASTNKYITIITLDVPRIFIQITFKNSDPVYDSSGFFKLKEKTL